MHRAGLVVHGLLEELRKMVEPGVTTLELEHAAERRIAQEGAIPAFKGYMNYPCVLCTSVNEQIVHGIPSQRKLAAGDILSIDVGASLDGYFADAAITVPVGAVARELQRLLRVTEEALEKGIAKAVVTNRLSDISAAIQEHVETNGFTIIRDFVGHGIGTQLHEEPQLPNYGRPGHGPRLQEGMVLAIEPMVSTGAAGVRILEDRWTAVTQDGGYAAHFEHCVAVTKNGPWVLTRRPEP
jgi:methionyl aminopeptidase